jgi:hypothetical protein
MADAGDPVRAPEILSVRLNRLLTAVKNGPILLYFSNRINCAEIVGH